jgi:hypothetical protein
MKDVICIFCCRGMDLKYSWWSLTSSPPIARFANFVRSNHTLVLVLLMGAQIHLMPSKLFLFNTVLVDLQTMT